jgi:hypothetical protein
VKPQLKRVLCDDIEDVTTGSPADPDRFGVSLRLMIGPEGQPTEDAFDLVICTAPWLADQVTDGGVMDLRYHLLVGEWDWEPVLAHIQGFLAPLNNLRWMELAGAIGRHARWESQAAFGRFT